MTTGKRTKKASTEKPVAETPAVAAPSAAATPGAAAPKKAASERKPAASNTRKAAAAPKKAASAPPASVIRDAGEEGPDTVDFGDEDLDMVEDLAGITGAAEEEEEADFEEEGGDSDEDDDLDDEADDDEDSPRGKKGAAAKGKPGKAAKVPEKAPAKAKIAAAPVLRENDPPAAVPARRLTPEAKTKLNELLAKGVNLGDALKQVAQWETFVAPVREAPPLSERMRPGGHRTGGHKEKDKDKEPGADRRPNAEFDDETPAFSDEEVEDASE